MALAIWIDRNTPDIGRCGYWTDVRMHASVRSMLTDTHVTMGTYHVDTFDAEDTTHTQKREEKGAKKGCALCVFDSFVLHTRR